MKFPLTLSPCQIAEHGLSNPFRRTPGISAAATLSIVGVAITLLAGFHGRPGLCQAKAPGAQPPPAGASTAGFSPEVVRKAKEQWQSAVDFQKAKKYSESIAAYNAFLKSTKAAGMPAGTALAAHQNLVLIYRAQGNAKDLIESLKNWSTLAPDNASLHAEIATLYASRRFLKFEEAGKEARLALALKPTKELAASAHSTLGIVAVARKDYASAEQEFGASIKLVPNNAQMEYNYALALVERKKFVPALASMQRAAAINPKMAGAWYYIGMLNESQAKYPEAIKAFKQAVRLAPKDPTIQFDLARSQIRANDIEGAITSYLGVLDVAPTSIPARIAAAQLYIKQNNFAAARIHFAVAAKNSPKNAPVLAGLAQCEAQLSYQPQDTAGRTALLQRAEDHYRAAAAIDPTFLVGEISLARFYEKTGSFAKAQDIYRKRIEADPKSFANYNGLAGTYLMQRKPDESIATWRRYRALYPADPAAYLRTAETLESQAKWMDAVSEWKLLLAQKISTGTEASALVAIGRDLARAGKNKEAIEHLEGVLKLDTSGIGAPKETRVGVIATVKAERIEAMQQIAQISESNGNFDDAIRWQQQVKAEEAATAERTHSAPNSATYFTLARLFQRAKKPELAIKELDAATQTPQLQKESLATAYEELAQVYESQTRYDEAIIAQRRSSQFAKEPLAGRLRAAEVYQRSGRLPLAIIEFEGVRKDFPKDARVLAPLALAYRQAGQDENAIKVYDELLLVDPRASWARDQKAVVFTHLKRFDDARALYESQLVQNGQNRQLYANIAFVFQSEGKPDAFLNWAKPRFEKDPENATLMSVVLDEAIRQKKEEQGWALIRAAVDKHIGKRALLESAALLMIQHGKKEDALGIYRRIATQFPKDLTAQIALADQLFAAGQKDEATKMYVGLIARTDIGLSEKLNIRRQFARCCEEQGNSHEALAQLEEIVKADPNDFDSTTRLALQLEAAGRGIEAIPLLRNLAGREIYTPVVRAQIYDKVGALLVKKGEKAAAETEYRKALTLNPKDTVAEAALAQLAGK